MEKDFLCIFKIRWTVSTVQEMWIQYGGLLMDSDTNVCTLTIYSLCLNTVCFSAESGISFLSEQRVFR